MTEIFISAGTDGIAAATALAHRLTGIGIAVTLDGGADAAPNDDFASIERADRVVLLLTLGWQADTWPRIERYLARAARSPVAFLAKLALVDLSEGTAAPDVLRPLLGGGIRVACSRAPFQSSVDEMTALAGLPRAASPVSAGVRRHVFVVGHPGSGKSTFCALLEARLRARGIDVAKMDPYPFLQTLFRIDLLRRDATRFESDALSEFLIKDPSVLDESVLLTKAWLSRETAAGRPAIVELAFADGPAVADIVSSQPGSIIVHVAASLDACKRNNEARGAIMRRRLGEEDQPSAAFDHLSRIHYVPPRFYERYEADRSRWEAGASALASLVGARYHRFENKYRDLPAYLSACDAFIRATLWPLLGLHRCDR